MGFWSVAAPALASLAGGVMGNNANAQQSGEQHDWAVEDAANNRAWQENMSNSAHQREIKDLKAAGLNPILSANKGASTPPGGAAQSPTTHPMQDVLGKGVASAMAAKNLEKDIKLAETQGDLNQALSNSANASAMREATTAKQNEATTRLLDATFGASAAEAKTRKSQAEIDIQDQNFWRLQKKIQGGLDIGTSAKDLAVPFPRRVDPRLRKHERILNEKTGETRLP